MELVRLGPARLDLLVETLRGCGCGGSRVGCGVLWGY